MTNTGSQTSAQARTQEQQQTSRRAVLSSLAGNALEWYDFFLYGTASSVIFGQLFFPVGTDPLVGTMSAFAGLAVGFAFRPLGGLIFGHIGDRYGRKLALVITLSIMGIATMLMGLLPTYASVGILAPVLLVALRILQGVAAGGEWGGGVLIISENSSAKRRGILAALSQSGLSIGFVLSSLAFYLVQLLPTEAFMSWGWRVPFLLSFVIFGVGLYIRRKLPEHAPAPASEHAGLPAVQVIKRQPREVAIAMLLRMAENGAAYIFLTFSLVYGTFVGVPTGTLLIGLMVAMTAAAVMTPLFGWLSDQLGRRPVYFAGALGAAVFAYPFFALIRTGNQALVMIALVVGMALCHAAMIGTQPAFYHELFDPDVRYSGMAMGHELASIFAGGVSPLIATALLAHYRSATPVAIYIVFLVVLTMIGVALSRSVPTITQRHGAHR